MRKTASRIIALLTALALTPTLFTLTSASTKAANDTVIPLDFTTVEDPVTTVVKPTDTPTENLPDPVIMNFSSLIDFSANAHFRDFDGEIEGVYKFVTLPDGTGALKLEYSVTDGLEYYRTMPSFLSANQVTDQHKYIRLTFMTPDTAAGTVTLYNNGNRAKKVIVENTVISNGNFVRSDAVDIASSTHLARYISGMHCTIMFSAASQNAEFYLKELAFFASEAQAYEYYGDAPTGGGSAYDMLSFGAGNNGLVYSGKDYGSNKVNEDTKTVDITYAASTNYGVHYMAKLKANKPEVISPDRPFVRVLYSAKNPEGTKDASLFIINDGQPTLKIELKKNIADTNGEFVLSDTAVFPQGLMERLSGTGAYNGSQRHISFCTNAAKEGGEYSIKALYFFRTREEADAFTISGTKRQITVNGNDISKYTIIIDKDAPDIVVRAANELADQIKVITDIEIPVADDTTAKGQYEILVGASSRALSTETLAGYDHKSENNGRYLIKVSDNTLILTAADAYGVRSAVDIILTSYLYKGTTTMPDSIAFNSNLEISNLSVIIMPRDGFELPVNVETPTVFTEDFDIDDGYFTEEDNADNWKYEGGEYKTDAGDVRTLSYIHVYETNVDYTAKIKYTSAKKNGDMGLMLRYTAEHAWLKAGYDFEAGEWYIEYREGSDFYTFRKASAKATLTPNTPYILNFKADGQNITLSVNGVPTLTVTDCNHVTSGRIAMYAQNASVSVDDITAVLLSGQGTIVRNIVHTKLMPGTSIEGGSAIEMKDGSIIFQHQRDGRTFISNDNGKTWEHKNINYFQLNSYPSIIRLANGDLLQILRGSEYVYSRTSSDDGKTWVDGGRICDTYYNGISDAGANNVNDKVMQAPTSGNILFVQSYQATTAIDGRLVFAQSFVSTDNGKTWTKSETDSWEIEGNETEKYFGESKLIECADGTIRMYNSWNEYGCIVYSDSTDGGKTFGPIQKLTGFKGARSSMQICHDPYGETAHTYYMIWPYNDSIGLSMPRDRLALAKSTDGKNWEFICDVWRWDSTHYANNSASLLNQIVDPFVTVSKNAIIVGSGLSEYLNPGAPSTHTAHIFQEGHLWALDRATLPEGKPMNKFTDVEVGAQYYDAVTYVTENGLFQGTSDTTFAPSAVMNRSMFVTVLGRLDGVDTAKYTTPTFSDVVAGQWYTSYVEWAAANGVVNGIGNGLYGINDNVTVEQVCVILSRYNQSKAASKASGKTVNDFSDAASVSSWALDGVKWAVENGVYEGQNGKLNPQAPASRALVATMFMNYVTVYGK